MKTTAFFRMFEALADYIDYFPQDKRMLFNIPDTILFESSNVVQWFSTRNNYTGQEKQKFFRHRKDDFLPSIIYKAMTMNSTCPIIAYMVYYEDNVLKIRYLDRYELRDVLFVFKVEVPTFWILQKFIEPDNRYQLIMSDGKHATMYSNKHQFSKYAKLHEACLTVETKDKTHIEMQKLMSHSSTCTNAIETTLVARACLAKFSSSIKRNKDVSFYMRPDKTGKIWLLWCFIPYVFPIKEIIDISTLIENNIPFSKRPADNSFADKYGLNDDDDDDDDEEDEEDEGEEEEEDEENEEEDDDGDGSEEEEKPEKALVVRETKGQSDHVPPSSSSRPSTITMSPRMTMLARHRITGLLQLTEIKKAMNMAVVCPASPAASESSSEKSGSKEDEAEDTDKPSSSKPRPFEYFTTSIALLPDKPRAIDRRLQRIRKENDRLRKRKNRIRDPLEDYSMNYHVAGSNPLIWSTRFGDKGRHAKQSKENARLGRIKKFKKESEILFDIMKAMVSESCSTLLRHLLAAADIVDQSKSSLKSSALNMAASIFMVKEKGGRLFPDEKIAKYKFYTSKNSPFPDPTPVEEALQETVKILSSIPNQRPTEDISALILWILQDMDAGLRVQSENTLEEFKAFASEIESVFDNVEDPSLERKANAKRSPDEYRNVVELRKFYVETPLQQLKLKKEDIQSSLGRSASVQSISSVGSIGSLRRSGSNLSVDGSGTGSSTAFTKTGYIIMDGLRPSREFISSAARKSGGFAQIVTNSSIARQSSQDAAKSTSKLSRIKKVLIKKLPRTVVEDNLRPSILLTHIGMGKYMNQTGWKLNENTRTTGITSIADFITERVAGESKKIQFNFFVSQQRLEEMKKIPAETIAMQVSFKVKKKDPNVISATSKMNSKQKSIIFVSLLSDVARSVLLKLLGLVRLVWTGEELNLDGIKQVFGNIYTTIDEKQFIDLQKWLHINRTSASGFELLSRMNLELAFARLYSFWPKLAVEMTNLYNDDNVQPVTTTTLHWPDKHTVDTVFTNIYKFETNLSKL